MKYRTKDGDMLDAICHAYYGAEAMVPQVLEANPGLAGRGAVYPAGVEIILPDLTPAAATVQPVRLWD